MSKTECKNPGKTQERKYFTKLSTERITKASLAAKQQGLQPPCRKNRGGTLEPFNKKKREATPSAEAFSCQREKKGKEGNGTYTLPDWCRQKKTQRLS